MRDSELLQLVTSGEFHLERTEIRDYEREYQASPVEDGAEASRKSLAETTGLFVREVMYRHFL